MGVLEPETLAIDRQNSFEALLDPIFPASQSHVPRSDPLVSSLLWRNLFVSRSIDQALLYTLRLDLFLSGVS